MTKPTQAQIEAGSRALLERHFVIGDDGSYYKDECEEAVKAILTAAVGEPVGSLHLRNEIEAFTIERCAQVEIREILLEYLGPVQSQSAADRIAAAIRALKDKPTLQEEIEG